MLADEPQDIITGCWGGLPQSDSFEQKILASYPSWDHNFLVKHGVHPSRIWIHWLTSDRRGINALWNVGYIGDKVGPKLAAMHIDTVVEPDYSTWGEWPKPIQLLNMWKSRTVARALQNAGLKIVPNIVGHQEWTYDFVFRGYPPHLKVALFDLNHQGKDTDFLIGYSLKRLEKAFSHFQSIGTAVVYGGGKRMTSQAADCIRALSPNTRILFTRSRASVCGFVYSQK